MIVKDTGGANFAPHPQGQYPALCIDVVDVGWMPTQYGPKCKVRLVFYCGQQAQRMIEGVMETYPMLVFATHAQTLSERGNLRPFLESWRGRAFTPEQLKGFDLDHLLLVPAFLQVLHNETGEYANVQTIMPMPEGFEAPAAPSDYQRVHEREGYTGPNPHPDMSPPAVPTTTFPAPAPVGAAIQPQVLRAPTPTPAPVGVGTQLPVAIPAPAAQPDPDDDLPF